MCAEALGDVGAAARDVLREHVLSHARIAVRSGVSGDEGGVDEREREGAGDASAARDNGGRHEPELLAAGIAERGGQARVFQGRGAGRIEACEALGNGAPVCKPLRAHIAVDVLAHRQRVRRRIQSLREHELASESPDAVQKKKQQHAVRSIGPKI